MRNDGTTRNTLSASKWTALTFLGLLVAAGCVGDGTSDATDPGVATEAIATPTVEAKSSDGRRFCEIEGTMVCAPTGQGVGFGPPPCRSAGSAGFACNKTCPVPCTDDF